MKTYYALVHKDVGSAYGITFPDLPGCFAAADEAADINEAAQTALVLYAQDETSIPAPRTMPELQSDTAIKAELAAGAALLAVPLIIVERKARYNVMLDEDLVRGVDQKARVMGISRSEFLSAAARASLKVVAGAAVISGSRTASTGKKTASAASKVLTSKTASKDEKAVAASAMAQTKTKDVTGKAVASKAGKVLHDPKASADAKSAAASALAQAPARRAPAKKAAAKKKK